LPRGTEYSSTVSGAASNLLTLVLMNFSLWYGMKSLSLAPKGLNSERRLKNSAPSSLGPKRTCLAFFHSSLLVSLSQTSSRL
jgi:hypothetical protein